jgi:hypothetical protein
MAEKFAAELAFTSDPVDATTHQSAQDIVNLLVRYLMTPAW